MYLIICSTIPNYVRENSNEGSISSSGDDEVWSGFNGQSHPSKTHYKNFNFLRHYI